MGQPLNYLFQNDLEKCPVEKSIHAVTAQGFELKVALFVIASSLNCYLNL